MHAVHEVLVAWLTATAGVTYQPLRSVVSTDAAAPAWPSTEAYAAVSARRPKM